MMAAGRDEKEIVALMAHQHRTMIAAIRHGKLDGKLSTLVRPQTSPMPILSPSPAAQGSAVHEAPAAGPAAPAGRSASPRPMPVQPPPAKAERTLDQVILEYLTNEADQEQLLLVLEGEADLALGRRASLALRTSSSKSGQPVAGAQVSVRMISTIAEPRVLAMGRTDEAGGLALGFEVPPLDRGTAAPAIPRVSGHGAAQVKHLL